MLCVEHISFSYRKKEVLHDISFTAKEGDFIGIIGKNGCGKSTLLSVLAGVRRPASGTLSFQDAPLFSKKMRSCRYHRLRSAAKPVTSGAFRPG